jgi:hypothetical protein
MADTLCPHCLDEAIKVRVSELATLCAMRAGGPGAELDEELAYVATLLQGWAMEEFANVEFNPREALTQ